MNKVLRRAVLKTVREQFRLEWQGIHGVPHWSRVRWNGLTMAQVNGARAADFTLELNRDLLKLDVSVAAYRVRSSRGGSRSLSQSRRSVRQQPPPPRRQVPVPGTAEPHLGLHALGVPIAPLDHRDRRRTIDEQAPDARGPIWARVVRERAIFWRNIGLIPQMNTID